MMGPPPKPSASGFGGERRCDGVSETCPVSQGQGEGYTVRTDESEGLSATWVTSTPQSAPRADSSPYTGEPLAGSDPEHCRISWVAECLPLPNPPEQGQGSHGPGKPRPLPQQHRKCGKSLRRRKRRFSRGGPDVEMVQL